MVRWVAAAGAFVVSLDSMVNIAFPAIAAAFGAPPERMRWIIICYTGSYAVMSFVAGAAADRIGHARVPVARAALGWALTVRPRESGDASRRLVAVRDVLRAPVLVASGLSFVANAAIFAIWLLAPFYIVGVRGLSASAGGVLFMLTPLGTAAAAPLAGWLSGRRGVLGFQPAFAEAFTLAALAVAGAAVAGLAVGRARAYTPGR